LCYLTSTPSGRADDNIETIRKRFKGFTESTMPVVNYYASLGRVRSIHANMPPTDVYKEVQRVLDAEIRARTLPLEDFPSDLTFAFFKVLRVWSCAQRRRHCADAHTRTQPDLVSQNKDDEVLGKIRAAGFEVVAQRKAKLPRDIVETFYAEHKGREFFPVSGAARGEPTQR
jgi:hypothetical protein